MNLYLIAQDLNNDYDTFDSAVVVAESEEAARLIHPAGDRWGNEPYLWDATRREWRQPSVPGDWAYDSSWVPVEQVNVTYLGKAAIDYTKPAVLCSSFNAG